MSEGGAEKPVATVLVLGSDRAASTLRAAGFDVSTAESAEGILNDLDTADAVVAGLPLAAVDSREFLYQLRDRDGAVPVVLVGEPDGDAAVAAIEIGAADFVRAGDEDELPHRVGDAIAAAIERRGIRARRDQLATLHDVAAELSSCDTVGAACEVAIEAAEDVLEFDICLVDIERDGVLEVVASSEDLGAEGFADMQTDEGISGLTYQRQETYRFADIQTDHRAEPQGEYRAVLSVPVGDHGVFQAGSREIGFFDEDDEQLAELLVAHLEAALTRIEREEKLELLHTVTRDLVGEETRKAVLEAVVEGTERVLGDGYASAFRYDEADDVLRLVAAGSRARREYEPPPEFAPGEGILGWAFERGEEVLLADAQQHDRALEEGSTSIRSYGVFPLGQHGVFLLTSPEVDAFDRGQTQAAHILAANTRVALDRVQRETALRTERNFVESALDSLDDVFFYTDHGIERWNRRLLAVTDRTPAEIEGADPASLLVEEDRARMHEALSAAGDGDRPVVEAAMETARGTIPYEFRLTRVVDDSDVRGIVGVGRDVSKRLAREKELERQNERLEQFASYLSHDLRNPLSVAHGRLELALDRKDDEAHIQKALEALNRMDALVEEVLSFARHGTAVVETEPVSLAEISFSAWETVAEEGGTLGTGDLPMLAADEGRVRTLLENLFRNALDHGGADVTVTVEALEDGFAISDDGPGIDPERRDEVFEYGHSGDDGSGFGLAIVDEIAAAHGWDIQLTENEEGGARFEFHGVEFADDEPER